MLLKQCGFPNDVTTLDEARKNGTNNRHPVKMNAERNTKTMNLSEKSKETIFIIYLEP
jgi:hypothetical protein